MTIEAIEKILPKAWTPRKGYRAESSLFVSGEAATGQCAVTALVLQDYFGGEIAKVKAFNPADPRTSVSHYFNVIEGKKVDITMGQFKVGVTFSETYAVPEGFSSMREYALSYPDTVERYEQLKAKINELLRK